MRDNFREIMDKLEIIKKEHPDLHFGKIIQMSIDNNKKSTNVDLHSMNEKEISKSLDDFTDMIRRKKTRKIRIDKAIFTRRRKR